MKLEAIKRQGTRTDLTSVPVAQELNGKTSREIVCESAEESQDQIGRDICLTNLMKLEAIKRQDTRADLTSTPVAWKFKRKNVKRNRLLIRRRKS